MEKLVKLTQGKRFLSLILAVVMMATVFNMALPMLKLDANAAGTIDGVSQTRIVGTDGSYGEIYAAHSWNYGQGVGEPTNIVVPGLSESENYVIQGMAYYPQKDWILVTAYHNSEESVSSKVFCLDSVTGDFVAMLSFRNVPDASGVRTVNYDHGGGIAISEHNLYYSCGDKDRSIAYAPLSALDGIQKGEHRVIDLVDEITLYETGAVVKDSKTAYTAYVCYDQGILWTGNFYDKGVVNLIATDYNAPANNQYNSMVWGYRLSGNSSEDEWANLKSGSSDCQGSPSYVIALNNNIKQVQYAVVDNGKLYLSCSYGTGAGGSTTAGYDAYSSLHIADIDLTVPGTETISNIPIDAAGTTKSFTGTYVINDYNTIKMPPMSEGLCVVNDQVYMTFESASYKYYKKAGVLGNCEVPIDVVWKIDQYKALGVERIKEEKALHYEEVTSANFTDEDAEYIIAYESTVKDPVTQRNYLYALNSNGGYKNNKLSKNNSGGAVGYVGMEAHVIKEYDIKDGILYLNNAEKDDVENIRWNITNAGIKSSATYFASQPYLYFTGNAISMTKATKGSEIKVSATGDAKLRNGNFYLSNNNSNYLWCNDGTNSSYQTAINTWYDTQDNTIPMYSDVDAKPGMIYADGTNDTNIIGKMVDSLDHGQFRIFKRVVDDFASTQESKIYTDLDAVLQEDGTYTINLETYATAPTQTVKLPSARSTDFIFVLDASASMQKNTVSVTGYKRWGVENNGAPANLSPKNLTGGTSFSGDRDSDYVIKQGDWYNKDKPVYYKTADGQYHILYGALNNVGSGESLKQYYWAYYENGGKYYIAGDPTPYTWPELEAKVSANEGYTGESPNGKGCDNTGSGGRAESTAYSGVHYTYEDGMTRLDLLKHSVNGVIDKIAADSVGEKNHRIAIVQYGSNGTENYYNTGMYKNDGTFVQYNGAINETACSNAFFTKDKFDTLKWSIIDYIVTPADSDADTYSNLGYDMANGIISKSDSLYYADSDRSLCVIMITDGAPGNGSSLSESNTAANAAIAEVLEAKKKGASAYTIRIGSDTVDGFNDKLYLDYTSSEYNYAQSMANSGVANDNGVDYTQQVSVSDSNALNNFVTNLYNAISDNTKNGYAALNLNSILKEQLSGAFKIPTSNWSVEDNVSTYLVPGLYDAVGRVSFYEDRKAETTAVKVVQDETNRNLFSISNFDYSTNYIGKGKVNADGSVAEGNKLCVTITGVLADETADITNTSINNNQVTAIYHNNQAVKKFPTEYFNIPEYTYALDCGLQMLDTDVNGTLKSVSADLSAQRDANGDLDYKDASQKGFIEIADNELDLLYQTDTTATKDSGYVLIKRDNGKYDWFKINVVPASNVYYEENEVKDPGSSTVGNIEWESVGTTEGIYRNLPGEGDIYGYDEYYDNTNPHSNNSYLKVNISNKKGETTSKKKTFQFTGTGFDLVSACGPNTGVLTLVVKDSDGNRVKSFMVDTYYKDTEVTDNKDTEVIETLLSQVPVVKWSTNNHDTYTVEVAALFVSSSGAVVNGHSSTVKNNLIDTGLVMNSAKPENTSDIEEILENAGLDEFITDDMELVWFDDNSVLNGGTGVEPTKKTKGLGDTNDRIELEAYIDGFRVYNPLGTDDSAYSQSEKNVTYANVIDNLAPVDTSGNAINELFGIGYLTGLGEDVTNVTFADYQKLGPKGELYLKADKAITFKIKRDAAEKVMLGLRAVNGPATAQVNNVAIESGITSATEMYYDITNCVADGDSVLVTVTNTGSTLLAINHIKFSGGSTKNTTVSNNAVRSSTRTGDAAQVSESIFLPVTQADLVEIEEIMSGETIPATVKNGVVVPLVENDETVNPDDTTTPDVPEDDNTNGDTDTDNSETEDFSIFSLLELLISILEKILHNAFGTGNIA